MVRRFAIDGTAIGAGILRNPKPILLSAITLRFGSGVMKHALTVSFDRAVFSPEMGSATP